MLCYVLLLFRMNFFFLTFIVSFFFLFFFFGFSLVGFGLMSLCNLWFDYSSRFMRKKCNVLDISFYDYKGVVSGFIIISQQIKMLQFAKSNSSVKLALLPFHLSRRPREQPLASLVCNYSFLVSTTIFVMNFNWFRLDQRTSDRI